jgi:23S rRNA (uridine2552-2'-O)-methyltransferase
MLQIDQKYKLFGGKQTVIDLCGAPGGFSQIALERSRGKARIFLVDKSRVKPIDQVTIIIGDITKRSTVVQIQDELERSGTINYETVVLADCSPNVSGHWSTDHARQIWLSEVALGIANYFQATKFVTKVFQGEQLSVFLRKISKVYSKVKEFKPPTSRKRSAEMYVIATNRIISPNDSKLFDDRRLELGDNNDMIES